MKLISIIAGAALLTGCAGVSSGGNCNPSKSYASKGLACISNYDGSGFLAEMPPRMGICGSLLETDIPYTKDGETLVCRKYDGYATVAVRANGDPEADARIAEVVKIKKEQKEAQERKEKEKLSKCVTALNITLGASSRMMAYGLNKPETNLKPIYYNEISQNGALMGVKYETYVKTVEDVTRSIKKECKNDRECVGLIGYKSYKDTEKYYTSYGFDFDAYCSKQSE